LIINHSLESGTQLPYIKKAQELGYGVIVMNSNQHNDDNNGQRIRGSQTPESHFNYVWKNVVRNRCKAEDVAIVAHSYGGEITVSGASKNPDLIEKTFAVAFTDSVHYSRSNDGKYLEWMSKNVCNWVSSHAPLDKQLSSNRGDCMRVSAGTGVHEETSWKAFDSIWKYFNNQWENRKLEKTKRKDADDARMKKDVEKKAEQRAAEASKAEAKRVEEAKRLAEAEKENKAESLDKDTSSTAAVGDSGTTVTTTKEAQKRRLGEPEIKVLSSVEKQQQQKQQDLLASKSKKSRDEDDEDIVILGVDGTEATVEADNGDVTEAKDVVGGTQANDVVGGTQAKKEEHSKPSADVNKAATMKEDL